MSVTFTSTERAHAVAKAEMQPYSRCGAAVCTVLPPLEQKCALLSANSYRATCEAGRTVFHRLGPSEASSPLRNKT